MASFATEPRHASYDVVIVGGAMMGSSAAWWLMRDPHFDGRVLVLERDPTYAHASTTGTNSCIRQQFSTAVNIRISQFGVRFIREFRDWMADPEAPEIRLEGFGYLYLAGTEEGAAVLRENQRVQASLGVATRLLTPEEIAAEFPFMNVEGIVLGSHNPGDEGYFDGATVFDWFRRKARAMGAEYVAAEVAGLERAGGRIEAVRLADGTRIAAGRVVNAAGPRAAVLAAMAGIDLPVEPRKRFSFVFDAARPLDRTLPLVIDPTGVHMRQDGRYYLCGCPPEPDPPAPFDDFTVDHAIWEEKAWPAIAHRVPAFEAVKVMNAWACHYAFNTFDHNAIVGPHPELGNFLFMNGFSGHGLQQAPAMGRGIAELVVHGGYRSLDLSELGYERILAGRPVLEKAVI